MKISENTKDMMSLKQYEFLWELLQKILKNAILVDERKKHLLHLCTKASTAEALNVKSYTKPLNPQPLRPFIFLSFLSRVDMVSQKSLQHYVPHRQPA